VATTSARKSFMLREVDFSIAKLINSLASMDPTDIHSIIASLFIVELGSISTPMS
jgi:hypothetical protein